MLILSRRIEESIFIGENAEIKITILGTQGRSVRIGIQAPKELPVHRQEIYERIQDEKIKKEKEDLNKKDEDEAAKKKAEVKKVFDELDELDEIRGNK